MHIYCLLTKSTLDMTNNIKNIKTTDYLLNVINEGWSKNVNLDYTISKGCWDITTSRRIHYKYIEQWQPKIEAILNIYFKFPTFKWTPMCSYKLCTYFKQCGNDDFNNVSLTVARTIRTEPEQKVTVILYAKFLKLLYC